MSVIYMVQNSTFENFIHIQHLFIHIKHLYVFSINICSKFNTYIYIQQLYLFTKLLSIQNLFIHSTIFLFTEDLLRISLTHGSDVLPAADEQGAAKKRMRSLEL